jgi:hypothetical protein
MSDRIEMEAYVTPEPAAGAVDAVMRAVADAGTGSDVAPARPSRWPLVAAAVVAVAAVVVLLVLLRGERSEVPAPAPGLATGDDRRDAADGPERDEAVAPRERAADDNLVRRLPDRAARDRLMTAIELARAARLAGKRPATLPGGGAAGGGAAGGGAVLDKESIREAMGEIRPLLIECYQMALERDPDLGGTLRAEFTIVGEEEVGGLVGELALDADDGMARDPELMTCLHETIMSLELPPPPGGGEITVRYPFVFRNSGGDEDGNAADDHDESAAKRPTHRPPTGPPGHGPPGDEVSELTNAARDAAKSGQWGRALALGEKALAIDPADQEARMVCAIAACSLRSAAKAERHLGALRSPSRRGMARQICLKNGVELAE